MGTRFHSNGSLCYRYARRLEARLPAALRVYNISRDCLLYLAAPKVAVM
jgi:hypothetical protein